MLELHFLGEFCAEPLPGTEIGDSFEGMCRRWKYIKVQGEHKVCVFILMITWNIAESIFSRRWRSSRARGLDLFLLLFVAGELEK